MRRIMRILAVIGLVSLLASAFVSCDTSYVLQAIVSSPKAVDLAPSESRQLTITAGYNQGASINVTMFTTCTYSTSDATVATVTTTGLVKGVAPGSAEITASYSEDRVTKKLTIPVMVK